MNMPGHGTSGSVAGRTIENMSAGSFACSPDQPPTAWRPRTASTAAATSSTTV